MLLGQTGAETHACKEQAMHTTQDNLLQLYDLHTMLVV